MQIPFTAITFAVLLTNDDGWATAAIRALHQSLVNTGIKTILSAPADNQSGTGSLDHPPTPRVQPCQFDSCPPHSPPMGYNSSDPSLNYVNSYPVTAVNYGISNLFSKPPDIVLSGPNVGTNTGFSIFWSGTIGAAAAAAQADIPAVAISTASGAQVSYATLRPNDIYSLHADLTLRFLRALRDTASPTEPILPLKILLNVNYPAAILPCISPFSFSFVLTRAFSCLFCNSSLPYDSDVLARTGSCQVSVSVLDSRTKSDAEWDGVYAILDRLNRERPTAIAMPLY